jgi:hypothetical protein
MQLGRKFGYAPKPLLSPKKRNSNLVIPTGAKRSGGTCSFAQISRNLKGSRLLPVERRDFTGCGKRLMFCIRARLLVGP